MQLQGQGRGAAGGGRGGIIAVGSNYQSWHAGAVLERGPTDAGPAEREEFLDVARGK